ncbi:unnamed protein product, partial [Polarella glacialis]
MISGMMLTPRENGYPRFARASRAHSADGKLSNVGYYVGDRFQPAPFRPVGCSMVQPPVVVAGQLTVVQLQHAVS